MQKFILAACFAALAAVSVHTQMNSDDLKWGPAPAVFPKGAQMAVLSGEPGKAGLLTVRLRMPAGSAIQSCPPPTTECVTVVAGGFALGMGGKLDTSNGITLPAGGFAAAAAG